MSAEEQAVKPSGTKGKSIDFEGKLQTTRTPVLPENSDTQTIMRALADPNRYRILQMMAQCEEGVTACSAVRECIDLAPPTLSHHMKELRDAGLIREVRSGRTVQYKVRRKVFKAFLDDLRRDFQPAP